VNRGPVLLAITTTAIVVLAALGVGQG